MSVAIRRAVGRRLGDGQRQRWLWALGSAIPVLGLPVLAVHARSRRTLMPPIFGLAFLGMVAFIPATFVVLQPGMVRSLSPRGAQPLVVLLAIGGFAWGHKLGQDKAAVDGRQWLALDR
ncbi:MAG: hypothetical protein WAM11_08650 [Cyanobium sp.]